MAITVNNRAKYFLVLAHPGKLLCADCLASKLDATEINEAFAALAREPEIACLHAGCSFCAQIKEVLVHVPKHKK
jgi:hypothetical protein